MKIELDKNKFEHAISRADKITGKHTSMPVLKCVLLVAKGKTLKVRSTNLDLGIEISVPAKIESEGVVAVPGDVINGFLSNVSGGGTIGLEIKGKSLSVTTQNSHTLINTQPSEDFPVLSTVSGKQTAVVGAPDLVKGLRSVWYAASPSSMKPELSSVFAYYDDNMLVFAATDSFRLAEKRLLVKKIEGFDSVLIPLKNIPEIIRNLEETDEDVELKVDKNQASLSIDGTYLTSRVIEGTFPDYKQIIPTEQNTKATALKQDLIDALKISNVFSNQFNQVNFKIHPAKRVFRLETSNAEVGESTTSVSAATEGDEIEIGFNYKYVMDCFQSVYADSVSLGFTGRGKPMVIRGVGDASFMYLVMPMNK